MSVALALAGVGAAAPLGGLALIAHAHYRFVRYHLHKGLEVPIRGPVGVIGYHLRELGAMALLGAWHVGALLRDRLRTPREPMGRAVLCVHGFTQNGTNMWGIRRHLERLGRPTRAVSLGPPLRRMQVHASRLERALADLVARHPDGVDVVAHSMGGVVLRVVLDRTPALRHAVHRVVTLGSPHHGTAATRGVPLGLEVAQMSRRSRFLTELPDFRELAPAARVTTVAAQQDLVVYPASTCHLPGAEHIDLPRLGHCGLLTWRTALDVVERALS